MVVIEDGIRHGGIASTISEMFRDANISVPIHSIGVPLAFIEHSKRGEILTDLGMTARDITRELVEWSSALKDDGLRAEKQLPEHENERRPGSR